MSDPVTFEVVAADEAAEIYLIDGDFRLVDKGVGRKTFIVPPGIYKIKNRSGQTTAERLIVVQAGLPTVELAPVAISSAMPLDHSARTHEYHMSAAAAGTAGAPALSHGSGSNIVIVARQWTGREPRSSPNPPNPARGLTLLEKTGTLIADVAALATVSAPADPIATLNVELTPGSYRLSLLRADGRRVEQTLIASPGWQTHVYLLVEGIVEDEAARVDLVNGAITLRRPAEPFNADDASLRAEEIARGILRGSHKILSDAMRAQFTSAAASPMLALVGAHLLIREANDERERLQREPGATSTVVDGNRGALRIIVDNLRRAVGGSHPDVEAVATVAGNPDTGFVFDVPPMMRRSWPLLLALSVERPAAIPAETITARAAERIWGEGTWLQWLGVDEVDRTALWQAKARDLLASYAAAAQAEAAQADAAVPENAATAIATSVAATAARSVAASVGTSVAGSAATSAVASAVASVAMPIATLFVGAGRRLRTAQRFFMTRSRTPFPSLAQSQAAQPEQATSSDLRGVRDSLTDEHRAQLVRLVGVPLSKIDAWLNQVGP
jgi:hypothetical protein